MLILSQQQFKAKKRVYSVVLDKILEATACLPWGSVHSTVVDHAQQHLLNMDPARPQQFSDGLCELLLPVPCLTMLMLEAPSIMTQSAYEVLAYIL